MDFWARWALRLAHPNPVENPPADTQANDLNRLHASRSLIVPAREQPPRPRDPLYLPQSCFQVGKITQAVADEYAVEKAIWKWETCGIRAYRFFHAAGARQP